MTRGQIFKAGAFAALLLLLPACAPTSSVRPAAGDALSSADFISSVSKQYAQVLAAARTNGKSVRVVTVFDVDGSHQRMTVVYNQDGSLTLEGVDPTSGGASAYSARCPRRGECYVSSGTGTFEKVSGDAIGMPASPEGTVDDTLSLLASVPAARATVEYSKSGGEYRAELVGKVPADSGSMAFAFTPTTVDMKVTSDGSTITSRTDAVTPVDASLPSVDTSSG